MKVSSEFDALNLTGSKFVTEGFFSTDRATVSVVSEVSFTVERAFVVKDMPRTTSLAMVLMQSLVRRVAATVGT